MDHHQVFGVAQDNIHVKLSHAIMLILDDSSANNHVGDSLHEHRSGNDYLHLNQPLEGEQQTVVFNEPPIG